MDTITIQLKGKRGGVTTVEIPTDDEILKIATRMHLAKEPALETILGRKVFYRP